MAMSQLNDHGEREVYFELNGQLRSLLVKDNEAQKVSGNDFHFSTSIAIIKSPLTMW